MVVIIMIYIVHHESIVQTSKKKGKAIPVTDHGGP
jgi:uncharacterized membrane protein